ncbi:MAG TPA: GYF domain-containing protein [Longimicrobium sp.]|nr:GYF domain-containing protein [Longimicrobium sp.]
MLDEAQILEICRDHSFSSFWVDGEIPAKKLRNAREHFPIPAGERVFALYDATVFGSAKEGFAVCATGVYWRNGWTVPTIDTRVTWQQLPACRLKAIVSPGAIELGDGNSVGVLLDESRAAALELFTALRHAAAGVYPSVPGQAPPVLDQLTRLCRGAGEISGFFLRPNIPEKKLDSVHEHYAVLPSDPVVLLLDTSVFGGAKTGLAVTESGLYWRNKWHPDAHQRSPYTWADFAACPEPRPIPDHQVEFEPGVFLEAVIDVNCRDATKLLRELWEWARAQAGITGSADEPAPGVAPVSADAPVAAPSVGPPTAPAAAPGPPPPPPAPAPQRWMLARDGQTFGPYDTVTVEAMLKSGQVDPATAHAWTEGMPQWLPFRQVPALALLEPSAAPTPPPPPPFASAPPPPPGATAPQASAAASAPLSVDDGRVDVNRAPEDELLALPGITLERARRILERRAAGGFASAAELGAFLALAPHEVQALAAEAAFGPAAAETSTPPRPSAPAGRVVDF